MSEHLTVSKLYSENKQKLLFFRVNEDIGHDKLIRSPELTRPGVELAGYWQHFEGTRIQIFGNKEVSIIKNFSEDQIEKTFSKLLNYKVPCLIFTNNRNPHRLICKIAAEKNVAVLRSRLKTTELMIKLGDYLSYQFAPSTTVHGSLIDIYGIGVLFTGRSGIGKSEVALDLVERGHRLVADDIVYVTRPAEELLIGSGTKGFEHNLEVRGIGIINVQSIFGIRAVRRRKRLEVQVELVDWTPNENFERVGLSQDVSKILDVSIPKIKLPIFPGKNITVISEVIALNHLLKIYGYDPVKDFQTKLITKIKEKQLRREIENYLRKDFE